MRMFGFFLSLSKRLPLRLGGPALAPHKAGGCRSGQAANVAPAARPALSSARRRKRATGRRGGDCVGIGDPPLTIQSIRVKRASGVSVMGFEGLHSGKSATAFRSTDRPGIVGQKPAPCGPPPPTPEN